MLLRNQGLQLGNRCGLYRVPLFPQDADQILGLFRVPQDLPDGGGNDLLQLFGGDSGGVAIVLPLFLGALVVVVTPAGCADRHGRLALAAKDLAAQGIVPHGGGPTALLAFVGSHTRLHCVKQIPVNDWRDGIFQPDGLVVLAVGVAGAIGGVEGLAIDQRADVFLVVQQVVQGVASEGSAPLGFDAVLVEPVNDLLVGAAGGVLLENSPDGGGFLRADNQLSFLDIVAQGRLAAGVLAVFGHVLHLFHDLLPGLQGPDLIKQRHAALGQKIGWVAEIAADHGLGDADHGHTHGGQLIPEGEPGRHLAEHPGLVVDYHGVRKANAQLGHHGIKLGPCVLHPADGLVGEHAQNGDAVLVAILGAFGHLHVDAVRVLVVGGVSGVDKRAVLSFHVAPPGVNVDTMNWLQFTTGYDML